MRATAKRAIVLLDSITRLFPLLALKSDWRLATTKECPVQVSPLMVADG